MFDYDTPLPISQRGDMFERLVRKLYEHFLRPGDVAIDAGADAGQDTLPMAECVGPEGRVHAFEPIPALADRLRTIAPPQVTVHQCALADEAGPAEFTVVPAVPGWSSLRRKHYPPEVATKKIQVQQRTLDGVLWRSLPSCRFYKIDIEGAEIPAIVGSAYVIARHRPAIVLENGGDPAAANWGYSRADWFAVFGALGYAVTDIYGQPVSATTQRRNAPWYTIAVASGSPDEQFLRSGWPAVVTETIATARKAAA